MAWTEETAALNASILREFGVTAQHHTFGSTADVLVCRTDPSELSSVGVVMVLFGDITRSGFSQLPTKNDIFTIGGGDYRAFDVQGPDESGGVYIHLTK